MGGLLGLVHYPEMGTLEEMTHFVDVVAFLPMAHFHRMDELSLMAQSLCLGDFLLMTRSTAMGDVSYVSTLRKRGAILSNDALVLSDAGLVGWYVPLTCGHSDVRHAVFTWVGNTKWRTLWIRVLHRGGTRSPFLGYYGV